MNPFNIPTELLFVKFFVLWKYEEKPDGKPTKVPYQVNGTRARSDDSSTWNTFEVVQAVYERSEGFYAGIGIVLSMDDPYVAIDIDDCLSEGALDTKRLSDFAHSVVYSLDSYTEITPSGNGIRVIVKATLPEEGRGRKTGSAPGCSSFEMYKKERFVTLTGNRLSGLPTGIVEAQGGIDTLYDTWFKPKEKARSYSSTEGGGQRPSAVGDAEVWEAIQESENAAQFNALWSGDCNAAKGVDKTHSAADLSLCNILAFYLWTADRIDAWFRRSGLMYDKWDSPRGNSTYGQQLAEKAERECTNHWSPRGTQTKTGKGRRPDASTFAEGETAPDESELPTIFVSNKEDRDISAEAWDAIRQFNDPPVLYQHGRQMSRVVRDPESSGVLVDTMDDQRLLHRLRRVANWKRKKLERKKDDQGVIQEKVVEYNVPVSMTTAKDMMADAEQIASLPALRAVMTSPVVSISGELISNPGYSRTDQIYLSTYGIADAAPTGDSLADAIAAYNRLFKVGTGIFGEFPFETDADRANAVALLLTQFLRPYINDVAPMFLVEAPTAGTGKSILARNLIQIATPAPRAWEAPTSRKTDEAEAEWTKLLGTALKDSPPVLFLDNLRGVLASTALESLLTSIHPWSTRLLRTSEEITVYPRYLTIVATSNNTEANRDMVRRSVSIRLDASMERPEDRTGFRITDLDAHIEVNRVSIVSDVLTILAAWITAGRPEWKEKTKGSFERWTRIIGGVLAFIQCPDFLGNEENRAISMDPFTVKWTAFVKAWTELPKEVDKSIKSYFAKDLVNMAAEAELISDANEKGAAKALGNMLQKQRDRVFYDHKLTGTTVRGGFTKWSIRKVDRNQKTLF